MATPRTYKALKQQQEQDEAAQSIATRTAEGRLISAIIRSGSIQPAYDKGITRATKFRVWSQAWAALHDYMDDYGGQVPDVEAFIDRCPSFDVGPSSDVAHAAAELIRDHARLTLLEAIDSAIGHLGWEAPDIEAAKAAMARGAGVTTSGTGASLASRSCPVVRSSLTARLM
jgi:hypothetical protein